MVYVSLVTGGRTGIGLGIANALATKGHKVIVTSRKNDSSISNHELVSCDVCTEEGVEKLKDYVESKQYSVQVLVNNVGHTLDISDPFCDIKQWDQILRVNLYSAVMVTNLCIAMMSKAGYGRIINIASNAGVENSGPVTFTTSKAALVAYTRSLGRVLATKYPEIVANAILPGIVLTPEGHWQKVLDNDPSRARRYLKDRCPLGRFGEIDEISSMVTFLASKDNSFSHGSIIPIDGGQAKGLFTYSYME